MMNQVTPITKDYSHTRVSNIFKDGVVRDEKWLDQIRSQELLCAITGQPGRDDDPIVPMHIGVLGTGIKAPDNEVLPALNSVHLRSHSQRGCTSSHEFWVETLSNDPRLLNDMVKAYAREYYAKENQ